MKKNKFKELISKKGFSIALYSCAAILVALTGIITANNSNTDNNSQTEKQNTAQVEQANQSDVKSYLENSDVLAEAPTEKTTQAEKSAKTEKTTQNQKTTKSETPKQEQKKSPEPTTTNKTAEEKIFSLFDDTKEMSWPVSGQIVMDYSTETAIYDKTLDQYRTNDSICIAAPVGTEIKASAEGIVKSISNDKENGTTVVLDHGNGWLSTYSQLQDKLSVREGDVVAEGAVLGTVAEPSYYSVLLGSHLEFKITKDEQCTDPKLVLAQYDE